MENAGQIGEQTRALFSQGERTAQKARHASVPTTAESHCVIERMSPDEVLEPGDRGFRGVADGVFVAAGKQNQVPLSQAEFALPWDRQARRALENDVELRVWRALYPKAPWRPELRKAKDAATDGQRGKRAGDGICILYRPTYRSHRSVWTSFMSDQP